MNAVNEVSASAGSGAVPVGTVIDFWTLAGTSGLPAGYEVCDGTTVATAGSPVFGLTKPDLRSRFVRGTDLVADEGTLGGVATNDLTHDHPFSGVAFASSMPAVGVAAGADVGVADAGHEHPVDGTSSSQLGLTENQPPFVVVLKLIRVL